MTNRNGYRPIDNGAKAPQTVQNQKSSVQYPITRIHVLNVLIEGKRIIVPVPADLLPSEMEAFMQGWIAAKSES